MGRNVVETRAERIWAEWSTRGPRMVLDRTPSPRRPRSAAPQERFKPRVCDVAAKRYLSFLAAKEYGATPRAFGSFA